MRWTGEVAAKAKSSGVNVMIAVFDDFRQFSAKKRKQKNAFPNKKFRAIARNLSTRSSIPGMPDGIFSNQNSQFGYILEGLGMQNVGILFGLFMPIWPFSSPFDTCLAIWGIFPRFGMMYHEKSGNPVLY
jgi:hypothetical protein